MGQNVSYHLLEQLARGHLRDSTRQTLDAVIESLQLLYSILRAADAQLAEHIIATGIEPYFAISWVITWFAHHVSPDLIARLFDLFIASHPLMPVYLYVEGMREVRVLWNDVLRTCARHMHAADMDRLSRTKRTTQQTAVKTQLNTCISEQHLRGML